MFPERVVGQAAYELKSWLRRTKFKLVWLRLTAEVIRLYRLPE